MFIIKSCQVHTRPHKRKFKLSETWLNYIILDSNGKRIRTIECAVSVAKRYASVYSIQPISIAGIVRLHGVTFRKES